MDYPEEWNKLPRHERRKKIKELNRKKENKALMIKKIRNTTIVLILMGLIVFFFIQLTKKTPQQIEFKSKVKSASLEGRVKKYPIEGRTHIAASTNVSYQTNPPTSGNHLLQPQDWGVYDSEIDEKATVHSLEHGGIWITYKDINDEDKALLKSIGKENSQSVIVSPRLENDGKIAVVSWGKMMKLDTVDKAIIQKYIDTYKNQSPEKLAR